MLGHFNKPHAFPVGSPELWPASLPLRSTHVPCHPFTALGNCRKGQCLGMRLYPHPEGQLLDPVES